MDTIDDLDRQLRDAAPYIDDGGFTRQVLAVLPSPGARRQRVRSVILLGMTILASLIAYLLGGQFVSQGVLRVGHLSPVVLLCVAVGVGVLAAGIGMAAAYSSNRDLQTSVWPRN